MFNLEALLAPMFKFVRETTRHGLHAAMQAGASDFVADVASAVRERPVIDHASLTRRLLLGDDSEPVAAAVPMPMPSAARVTEADDATDALVERAREMIASGVSQREAARQLGVAESTLRTRLKN